MKNKALIIIAVIIVAAVVIFAITRSNSNPATTVSTGQNMPSMSQQSSGSAIPAAKNTVTIANFSYSPSTLTVKVGDTVTWTNQDSVSHSATADDGSFDTGLLAQGKSGTVTFSKAGTYKYHCSIHPMMHGTIIVQ